jgi:protein TonB
MKTRQTMLAALLLVVSVAYAQQPDGPKSQPRIRVSAGVAEGLLKSKVDPEYPAEAKAHRIQGNVILAIKISTEGNVVDLKVVSGHPALAAAALEAVRQWKYKPYALNGEPVEIETTVLVKFHLG